MQEMWEDREEREDIYSLFIEFICTREPLILKDSINEIEAKIIENVLIKENGNIKRAAMTLSVKYTTLFEKLKKHNIRFITRPFVERRNFG